MDRPAIGNLMTLFDFQQQPRLARLALPVRPEPKTSHRTAVSYRLR
jgi:hypothetical protein